MSKPKVCVYVPVDSSGDSHRQMEQAGCDVVLGKTSWRTGIDRDTLLELSYGADALIGATIKPQPIGRDFFEQFSQLRIIAKYTIGVEDIDLSAATELGILVTHSPTEANWGGVAEGTIAFMLALLKRIYARDHHVKNRGWRDSKLMGTYIGQRQDGYSGLTIGIVGLGRCGSRVAELLAPWRVRLLACDPYLEEKQFTHCGAERVDLKYLLKESDVVTLHVTLTEETKKLIGSSELSCMKSSAILINACRGKVVDLDALCDALDNRELAGAALDVLPEEPPPKNSRILNMGDKVILCPHMISANSPGTLQPAIPFATNAALAALKGEVPDHVYNVDAIPRWLERFGDKSLIYRSS
ncbi:MAG: hypothetical protein CMM56_03595 [Rhodospirillaceae bacterium]|nr:hypothetical protein [Rhodospirillaceae bacterium]